MVPARAPTQQRTLIAGLLLAAVSVLIYVRTWSFDFTYLDDYLFLKEGRPFFEDWRNLSRAFSSDVWEATAGQDSSLYRPLLVALRFAFVHAFGAAAGPHHIPNTVLHAACVALLFRLMLEETRSLGASFAAALLFAIHPALTAAVAWIDGYNNSLLALCILLAAGLALKALRTGRIAWAVVSAFAFLAALLTKESGIFTPLFVGGLAWVQGRDGRPRSVRRGVSIALAISWTLAALLWWALRASAIPETPELESAYVRESVARSWPGLFLQWGKVFLPLNLSPQPILADSTLVYGVAAALAYAALLLWTRGATRRALLFGGAWFFAVSAPSLLASRLESMSGAIFREDRLYQAMIGMALALAFLLRDALREHPRATALAVSACAAAALVIGQSHLSTYANGMSFWSAAVRQSPHLAVAHHLLGGMYQLAGDHGSAKKEFLRALELNPRLRGVRNDVGTALAAEGAYAEADFYYREELARDPNLASAHYNRAIALTKLGQFGPAIESLQRYLAVTRDPPGSERYGNVRLLLMALQQRRLGGQEPIRPQFAPAIESQSAATT